MTTGVATFLRISGGAALRRPTAEHLRSGVCQGMATEIQGGKGEVEGKSVIMIMTQKVGVDGGTHQNAMCARHVQYLAHAHAPSVKLYS